MEFIQSDTVDAESSSRPLKRRRFYRKRANAEDEANNNNEATAIESPNGSPAEPLPVDDMIPQTFGSADTMAEEESEEPSSVTGILRQRKVLRRRRGGIEFTNTGNAARDGPPEPRIQNPLLGDDGAAERIMTVVDRFAPQTGQVADVDQHMMAYVDSEMAKRRQMHNVLPDMSNSMTGHPAGSMIDAAVRRQPASLGRLHEVDLGPDATSLNISRTEAAQRRLQGGHPEPEEVPGKVRLGKDGKPRRPRRRRNSGDIQRDKLVEEVLRENKRKVHLDLVNDQKLISNTVEIYDEPETQLPNDDQAADDRMAEQFRRDFLDAISERRKRMAHPKKAGAGAADHKPRGPKLGGSRSARAAMRELQEKAVKK
ncbi:MAG: hypothetical protein Q9191_002155 [Dirinaria sp. TL-2023a]